jgi:ATP-dependent helicase/DNAse subunit B
MENFYKKIIEKKSSNEIEIKDFDGLDKNIDGLIDEAFIDNYNLNSKQKVVYEGQRVVIREVLKKFSLQILKYDRQYTPFEIVALERKDWTHQLKINHTSNVVVLGGTIDRVDKKGNVVRVIDYKTGKDELGFADVESLFNRENSKRNKAAFQTLLYALLYKTNNDTSQKVIPGLLNRKNLFDDDFQFGLLMSKQHLNDVTSLLPEFEEHLTQLLNEIFDPSIKFNQTKNEKTCELCPYKGICYR